MIDTYLILKVFQIILSHSSSVFTDMHAPNKIVSIVVVKPLTVFLWYPLKYISYGSLEYSLNKLVV